MRSVLSVSILVAMVSACGGSAASRDGSSRDGASTGGERATATPTATEPTRVRTAAPPVLSDEVVAADAADPALVVSPETGWVVIPSFRIGVAMPEGWYWSDAEEMIRLTEATRHHLDEANQEVLRRGLQAIVNQYLPNDAAHAGTLIPSVRVLLLPGGLPRGARLADDFCQASVLPELVAVYPDAVIASHESLTLGGYPAARCGVDHSVTTVGGVILPAHSESALVFGESHVVMIAAVGGTEVSSADVLTGVLASIRSL
jgi:hypothetical protein